MRGAEIVVTGNDAEKFAEVFHVETRRPMRKGVINPDEPHSLAVLRHIITKLVGPGGDRRAEDFLQRTRRIEGEETGHRLPRGSIHEF